MPWHDMIPLLFLVIWALRVIGVLTLSLFKREVLVLNVVIDVLGVLSNILWLPSDLAHHHHFTFGLDALFIPIWSRWTWRDWKALKDYDDDDENPPRGRKWIRNKLKSFKEKVLPKPLVNPNPVIT